MAEMQLTTDERLKLTYEMRVPQIIELLDMSEQTLQKVRQKKIKSTTFNNTCLSVILGNCMTRYKKSRLDQLMPAISLLSSGLDALIKLDHIYTTKVYVKNGV